VPEKDLYSDLQRIEDRSKKKRHRGLSGMFSSIFGKGKDEEEEDEEEEDG